MFADTLRAAYLRRAQLADQLAADIADEGTRLMVLNLAARWRELAAEVFQPASRAATGPSPRGTIDERD